MHRRIPKLIRRRQNESSRPDEENREMELNLDRVRANVTAAETEDLLDRATVFRDGMAPEALEIIEAELWRRGVSAAEIAGHAERRQDQETLVGRDGLPLRCRDCPRPATALRWRLGWRWGILPGVPQ